MSLEDNSYLEFDFAISPLEPAREILIAELGELEFESFVEQETGLLAYVPKKSFKENSLENLFILQNPDFKISWSSKEIVQQNWNVEWERNFAPIMVNDSCMVRAPFHSQENVKYDIVIEPKMSFGTGHHETTHMMLAHILKHDFKNKKVLDMGCGTGVLAILAEKKGAQHVDAIDVDVWCYENALENVKRNDCKNINVAQGDPQLLHHKVCRLIERPWTSFFKWILFGRFGHHKCKMQGAWIGISQKFGKESLGLSKICKLVQVASMYGLSRKT